MPVIKLETTIKAPIEIVFDLARSINLHADSLSHTDEKAIAGRTSGLIELGETVTWEATHFGVRQRLTSAITVCERPFRFSDAMLSGAFARFDHEHIFAEADGVTQMIDVFDYDSPFWLLGNLADWLFLERYMTNLLKQRNQAIKSAAEGEDWKRLLAG